MPAEPNDKVFGLGLSVASRFCQLNLGRLHVESELELGSEFWLDIPAVGCADIFPRWLKLQTTAKRFLQLIEFQLCDSNSTRDIRDTELLLTFLTENDELLLQTAPTRWLLASSSILSDHQSRLKKAAGDLSRLAEVRAAKPNSQVAIESRGSWDLDDESKEIVERFAQILNEDQLM
jgi:hypothetical protein